MFHLCDFIMYDGGTYACTSSVTQFISLKIIYFYFWINFHILLFALVILFLLCIIYISKDSLSGFGKCNFQRTRTIHHKQSKILLFVRFQGWFTISQKHIFYYLLHIFHVFHFFCIIFLIFIRSKRRHTNAQSHWAAGASENGIF